MMRKKKLKLYPGHGEVDEVERYFPDLTEEDDWKLMDEDIIIKNNEGKDYDEKSEGST